MATVPTLRAAGPRLAANRMPLAVHSAMVVVPTYNEAENIARLVPELLALPEGLTIIIVDDASPDGTGALADNFARDFPGRLIAVHRPGKLGLGTAYLAGFETANRLGSDCIVTMDADFSHQPQSISALLARLAEADLVIGSRYVRGGAAVNSPPARRLLSRTANLVSRTALGFKAHDVTAGFRVYRSDLLAALP